MKYLSIPNFRRLSQGFFLLLFLFLFIQTESQGDDVLGYPVRLFLDFDPLLTITTLLASHAVGLAMGLSAIILIASVFLGRFFCGWICPLGTLHDLSGIPNRSTRKIAGPAWRKLKYYVLIFLIAASVMGLHLTGMLDPLSFLVRSLSLSIYPLFNELIRFVFDGLYNLDIPAVTAVSEPVYAFLKSSVLSFNQPRFDQVLFIGLLFLAVLSLNLFEKRSWCRYLCPLGALLGFVGRLSPLNRSVAEGCNACGVCRHRCPGGADPDQKEGWRQSECLYCGNCSDCCPRQAVSFGFRKGVAGAPLDLQRRSAVISVAGAFAAVPLFRYLPVSDFSSHKPLRPPGAAQEKEFLKQCLKCGECMKVCITNGLQPALLQAGLEGLWTPMLVPRVGYCEYHCTLCGQVCPTGAIRPLNINEKMKFKMGLAEIDEKTCLPYADGVPCIVCEEVCPISPKAILFDEVRVKGRDGTEKLVKQPRVDKDRCTGCGICENKCPVEKGSAIIVSALKA